MTVEQILQECKVGSLVVAGSSAVTVPSGTKVVIKDAIVFVQGGRVVGKLDAEYDFAKLDPALHTLASQIIWQRRIQIGMYDPKGEKEREERYEKRLAEYEALPWWKRLFRPKPDKYDS